MSIHSSLAPLLQTYFTQRLMEQRNASPHTIANYRDTFRLLLDFAQRRLKKAPSLLAIQDLDAPFVGRFLGHLEKDRRNAPQSRNIRLAAIHSFFKFVALEEPALGGLAQRVLAIQGKRYATKPVDFLTRTEIDALLAAPDLKTWAGRRDRMLILLGSQTGLRVSELIGLHCQDVGLGTGAHVRCTGKGRKTRCVPLSKEVAAALSRWLQERHGQAADPVFPNARGKTFSRDGVEYLISKHTRTARLKCPSLKTKRVSPHVLRHSAAMDLLQNGVDRSIIALWLGHEYMESSEVYLHTSLQLKEQALAKIQPYHQTPRRYRPNDKLLAFLKGL
jgi:site-specific recombinase XerD